MIPRALGAALMLGMAAPRLSAQTPLSRADAVAAALARGSRMAIARADSSLATAQVRTARAFQNPALTFSYSKSVPQYHAVAELPLDFLWLRGDRIGSAEAARTAMQHRFAFERAAIALAA